jgi:hypothetical protein
MKDRQVTFYHTLNGFNKIGGNYISRTQSYSRLQIEDTRIRLMNVKRMLEPNMRRPLISCTTI